MERENLGIIGMGVMGQNLALNCESKKFKVAVFNRTTSKTRQFIKEKCKKKSITGTETLKEFAGNLERPKKIILMVKAGQPVDDFIDNLLPLISKGDILIDCGNTFFKDTEKRIERVNEEGIFYLGCGVSGGEEGALLGPSIMPGGNYEAYKEVEDILSSISAKTEDGSCCAYLGKGGAGHFVKMVHNGIEYGIMEIISETYNFMRKIFGMEPKEIGKIFSSWNKDELNSYLIEISAEICRTTDEETQKPLVEVISDKAGQKGTGKWTSLIALDLGVPIPTINSAVEERIISSFKELREELSRKIGLGRKERAERDILKKLHSACYLGILSSYIQGFHLLRAASEEFSYNFDLSEVARIWKGGCIIRAKLLNMFRKIFVLNPLISHPLLNDEINLSIKEKVASLCEIVSTGLKGGISLPGMSSALSYYYSFFSNKLPTNLIQAQRDYFGAHTYQRIDKKGIFHTDWKNEPIKFADNAKVR